MSLSRRAWIGLAAGAGVLACATAIAWSCARTNPVERATGPTDGVPAGPELERRERLGSLRSRPSGQSPRFSDEEIHDPSNAELFTQLAESSRDTRVILAALEGIQATYAARSPHKAAPNANLERVLLKHSQSAEPSVALAALSAARIPLMTEQPGAIITDGLVEMATADDEPSRRHAALEALDLIRPDQRGARVLGAFEAALFAPEAHLISLALLALSHSGPSLKTASHAARSTLGGRVAELSNHDDPGVRGRALAVLAEIEGLVDPATRVRTARAHLDRDHPYVRAQAADLVARCLETADIHRLVQNVRDLEPARYDLHGWRTLDGSPGTLSHSVPGRKRVADAALFAIQSLSTRVQGVAPLMLTLGGPRVSDEIVLENAELALAWYRTARTAIRGGEPG